MLQNVAVGVAAVATVLFVGTLLFLSLRARMRRINRIKNYTCAEAQLVVKNAERALHKKAREQANKMLYKVLALIDQAARDERKHEMVIDTTGIVTGGEDAKKYRNAIKDALRNRGFHIIPPTLRTDEKYIHVSWQTSRVDK